MSRNCRFPFGSAENAGVDAFRKLFGPPTDLWLFNRQDWLPVVVNGRSVGDAEISSPPQAWECSWIEQPVARELGDGSLLIGMPVGSAFGGHTDDVGACVAWGTVSATASQLAATLMRTANLRDSAEAVVRELQTGVEPHLEQICRDFEELTWLRELQEHLFESSVDDSLAIVAERILPELRQLVAAKSIVVVTVESAQTGAPTSYWCGPQLLNDFSCRKLVDFLRSRQVDDRPVIVNHLEEQQIDPDFDGITACLQLPIIHRNVCYGWLVALNRSAEHSRYPALEKSTFADAVQNEFGTGDAGLLFSAASILASHARNTELFQEKERLLVGIIKAMINALDAKDAYTCGHSDRVATMAKRIGEQMGLQSRECDLLYMSGLLHDIGKIGIPDDVLLKPGKLTDEEFAIISQHPSIGHAILSHLPQLNSVLPGVLYHHEHLDGRGYPDGLKGNEIPLFGRILAVADAYDAMTTCRPYRSAMPIEKAQSILKEGAGTQWDPAIVEAFFETLPTLSTDSIHDEENLNSMYDSVIATGFSSLSEPHDAGRRLVGTWNGGIAGKP